MRRYNFIYIIFSFVFFCIFLRFVWLIPPGRQIVKEPIGDRVVLSAVVQAFLAGGDRYLAANLETFRVMSISVDGDEENAESMNLYRIRAYDVASQLNPCHEDNYYVANAILTWGGAPEQGIRILQRATDCRLWDYSPPFFLGIAQNSFLNEPLKARLSLNLAAERANNENQAASLHRIGVMMEAGSYQSTAASLAFLRHEMEATHDSRLKLMLGKRVKRIEGLQMLEEAQVRFENMMGRSLRTPDELLSAGVLQEFPSDPMHLGYVFDDGYFRLRSTD